MDRRIKQELMARLTRDANRICKHFGLRYKTLEAERANVKRRYGICYDDGTIKIRLRHVATGEPLKYSSLVNTLCHELAHLRHFDHSPRFQAYYLRLLGWAREQRIYRPSKRSRREPMLRDEPTPSAARAPVDIEPEGRDPIQLSLFV